MRGIALQDQSKKDPANKNIYKFSEPFLQQEDFLAIFESYDVLGIQTVPVAYLEQALEMVGVEDAKSVLNERYADLIQDNTVNKVSFVYVLQEEHKRSGFSYARPEWTQHNSTVLNVLIKTLS